MKFSRHMKGTPEEKVLAYIATHDHKPLVFSNSWCNPFSSFDRRVAPVVVDSLVTPRDWVQLVLKQSIGRNSLYLMSGNLQCISWSRRGAFDIWRHILYYTRDINLFQVMRALTEVQHVNRSYCSNVQKRVFWKEESEPTRWSKDDYVDEFGLKFEDWSHIGQ